MFSEDYVMRMLRAAIAVIQKAIGLKMAGEHQAALEAVNQMLEEWMGLPVGMLDRLDDQSLVATVTKENGLDEERAHVLAELFKLRGEILVDQGRTMEGQQAYQRALALAIEGFFAAEVDARDAAGEKVDALLDRLVGAPLPTELMFSVFNYQEHTGDYARAEAALLRLAGEQEVEDWVRDEVEPFYRRLLEKTDAELAGGGLTRSDIQAKLAGGPASLAGGGRLGL